MGVGWGLRHPSRIFMLMGVPWVMRVYHRIPEGVLAGLAMNDGILDDSVWSMHSKIRTS